MFACLHRIGIHIEQPKVEEGFKAFEVRFTWPWAYIGLFLMWSGVVKTYNTLDVLISWIRFYLAQR